MCRRTVNQEHRMKLGQFVCTYTVLAFSLFTTFLCPAQKANSRTSADATLTRPEAVGFSPERLENLHKLIQDEIDKKQLVGAITILARHGKIIDYRTYGLRDQATNVPMTKDTIFRDYSMTKPVTGVAMMI